MTTTFITVLQGAATLAGLGTITTQPTLAAELCGYLNQELRRCWETCWWPRLTYTEQRRYRASWASGTSYSAPSLTTPVEVWHLGSKEYFQALVASTGQAPATWDGTAWNVNGAYWARCALGYSGPDWAANTAYVIGAAGVDPSIVRNPADNRFYACHTPHTSTSTFDATKFGVLTPFRPYVAAEQTGETVIDAVRWLSVNNPEVNPNNIRPLNFRKSNLGYEVVANQFVAEPFVTFRRERPVFTTTAWSSGTAYVAGNLVYSSTTGQSYKCLVANTGQAVTNTTYWEVQIFPEWLVDPVQTAVVARTLNEQKQQSRAQAMLALANEQLNDVMIRELPQQEQAPRMTVNLRR